MKKNNSLAYPAFYFKKIGKRYLLTNDYGQYLFLNKDKFNHFISNKLKKTDKTYLELKDKGFIRNMLDFDALYKNWKNLNCSLGEGGPGLHIFVLTLNCDHYCVYCQASSGGHSGQNLNMTEKTAKKTIDFILSTTRKSMTVEFQGGEPLLNWNVLKKSVLYINKRAKEMGKNINISIVTNFSTMDLDKAKFIIDNKISVCTSLDGPEFLHNKNRIFTKSNSYSNTIRWLKYFMEKSENSETDEKKATKPSALLTTTKDTLKFYKEVIDEYVKLGLPYIFIRPLSKIGYAKRNWDTIGYSADEFIDFYKKSIDYIIKLNLDGKIIMEKNILILASKIIRNKDPRFLDLRSPCGAGIGQLAYNYNGDIYTCDEGRMIGWTGDDYFKIGNIYSSYENIINNETTKKVLLASILENNPMCSRCVYKPYCGQCPVINYATFGNLKGNNVISDRCKIYMGMFKILFNLLDKYKKVLEKWIDIYYE